MKWLCLLIAISIQVSLQSQNSGLDWLEVGDSEHSVIIDAVDTVLEDISDFGLAKACDLNCSLDIYAGQSNAARSYFRYDYARTLFFAELDYEGVWSEPLNVATGATRISQHLPKGNLFAENDHIIKTALESKLASGCTTVLPTIHWWQGESDTSERLSSEYPSRFSELYAYYQSIFGPEFRMFLYEINDDLVTYDNRINQFFSDFAVDKEQVTFVPMPADVTYENPPLNNHPAGEILDRLMMDNFRRKLEGDCGLPWNGYLESTTSVFEEAENDNSGIVAYPNPTRDAIEVIVQPEWMNGIFSLMDPYGRILVTKELSNSQSKFTLDLSTYEVDSGTFVIIVKSGVKTITKRIVLINQ